MTATAIPERAPIVQERAPADRSPGNPLRGTATLIRFALRRDRFRLTAWLAGLTMLAVYFCSLLTEVMANEQQRADLTRFMDGGLGAVFGPGYGREALTAERYLVGVYGLFFFVLAALMSIFLVARHTRADEQHGRTELMRASGVGRHAPLTAALVVAFGANGVLALLLGSVLGTNGYTVADGLLFGASVAAVGVVFAAITALTVQLTSYSRTAAGMAGAVLGGAWAIRAVGDTIGDHGSALSWLSPLAWSNQTRPYVDARWWPLLLSAALAAGSTVGASALLARRDLGAGLAPARPGRPAAATWLRTPFAAAFRLQRASLVWWTVALAGFGFIFGGLADQIADPEGISDDRIEMFGGSLDTLVDGYLGVMALFSASLAGIMALQAVRSVRADETSGRLEPVMATAASRTAWLTSHLAVTAIGLLVLLSVVGVACGLGATASTGDSSYVARLAAAHVAHAPGVLVLLGLAALLFGVAPRAINVVWTALAYGLFVALFGTIVDPPAWLQVLAPMSHTGRPPLDAVSAGPVVILLVVAAALLLGGTVGFRRRDLDAK